MNQYFVIKIKDEFLPDFMDIKKGKYKIHTISGLSFMPTGRSADGHTNRLYYVDLKDFRKLKIQNIEKTIKDEDRLFLNFLINKDCVHLLTQKEFEEITNRVWGYSGVSGTSGPGVSGVAGVSGTSGTGVRGKAF